MTTSHPSARALLRTAAACLLGFASLAAFADAGALRAKHQELRDELRNNSFQRALHIDSSESNDMLKGDVYAVLDHPYKTVHEAMKDPAQWCDILILPFNTKYCHAVSGAEGPTLQVRIGRKFDQPVEKAYRLEFAFRNVASGPDYFESRLNARNGPLGTRDYRITVSAIPLDANRTFLQLGYSYGYGVAGRLAMQGYLATVGADKVGFTATGKDASGKTELIGGVRGAVERNTMRYYLAIDSYLESLDTPAAQRAEKRIQHWFTETERYPRQLREMDRPTYVAMKRSEYERQQLLIQ